MPDNTDNMPVLEELIENILIGQNLQIADMALDMARRILWVKALTGKPPQCQEGEIISDLAEQIADLCVSIPLYMVAELLEGIRLCTWLENFPDVRAEVFEMPTRQ